MARRTKIQQDLKIKQNEVLIGIADSIKGAKEVHDLQTQYLMLKVASRKKRRAEVREMISGKRTINLLIVDPHDKVLAMANELGSINGTSFNIIQAVGIEGAASVLGEMKADVILLACQSAMGCPACGDKATCLRGAIGDLKRLAPRAPVIVCAERPTHECDLEAMNAGASDFLEGDEISAYRLEKSIRYGLRKTM